MALQHGATGSKLYGNGMNLGAFAKAFQCEGKRDTSDATPLDPTVNGGARQFTTGADSGTFSMPEVFLDKPSGGEGEVWSMLQDAFGQEDVIIAAPLGDEVERPAVLLVAGTTEASTPTLTDKTIAVSMSGQTQNGFAPGVVALPWDAYTDASEGDWIDLGAAQTNVIVEWGLVVGELDGDDVTFILQESSDEGGGDAAADVDDIAFTTGVVGGHSSVEVAALERYVRIIVDPTSTLTDAQAVGALSIKKR